MSKNSKKQKHDIIHKIKSHLPHLSDKHLRYLETIAKLPNDSKLPSKISLTKNQIDEETKTSILCFKHLNFDECVFNPIRPAELKAIMGLFKKITVTPYKQIAGLKIIRDTIKRENAGPYSSLFDRLKDDVEEIHETDISKGGRLFFFTGLENFYVVAIRTTHIDKH